MIIMKRAIYAIVALMMLGFVSCEDFLDKVPPTQMSNQLALSNFTNMTLATNAAYGKLLASDYYGRDMIVIPEIRGIDARPSRDKSSGRYQRNYAWKENSANSVFLWRIGYSVITSCSNVINAIEGYSELGVSQAQIDQIKGENIFLRALVHFDLCRVYAQPPISANGENNLGVPIVTKSEIGKPKRNTVQQVYAFIIEELIKAEGLLTAPNRGTAPKAFASKEAAQALLAKVYMYMNDWENAYLWADKVIKSGKYQMVPAANYLASWKLETGSSEVIFMVYGETTNYYWAQYDDIGFLYDPIAGYADVCATKELLDLFEAGDVRGAVFSSPGYPAGEKWCKKYPGKAEIRNNNMILLRLPEMYLIRAEADLNLGGSHGTALADYNFIRSYRGLGAAISVDKETIAKERRRELNNECNGMWDITRLGKTVVRATDDLFTPETPITLDLNHQVLPIINVEIEVNPNIVQNPGY